MAKNLKWYQEADGKVQAVMGILGIYSRSERQSGPEYVSKSRHNQSHRPLHPERNSGGIFKEKSDGGAAYAVDGIR